jgi:hypothetical protein
MKLYTIDASCHFSVVLCLFCKFLASAVIRLLLDISERWAASVARMLMHVLSICRHVLEHSISESFVFFI